MRECDGQRALACGAGCQGVVPRPNGIGRAARNARKHRDVENANGHDAHHQARPVNRREHDGRQQSRKGEGEV